MSSWEDFSQAAPDVATQILACLTRHPHHVLGTLDAQGAPRLSGINLFVRDGVLWFGSMPHARKVRDLERDPRVSVYSAPLSETLEGGDARISGRVTPLDASRVADWIPDSPHDGVYFEILLERAHLVEVVGEELVVTMWDTEGGVRIVRRQ